MASVRLFGGLVEEGIHGGEQSWSGPIPASVRSVGIGSQAAKSAVSVPVMTHAHEGGGAAASAVAMILASSLSVQLGAAVAIELFAEIGSWGVTTLRLVMAGIILGVLSRPTPSSWGRPQWNAAVLLGAAMAGMNGAFYVAIDHIPLGTAVAIEFIGPLSLAAILTRSGRDVLWVGVAMGGVALLGIDSVWGNGGLNLMGAIAALIAGAFWAGYIISSARVGQLISGLSGLTVALLIAAVMVAPLGFRGVITASRDPRLLALAAGAAVLASVIPYSLELNALRRISRALFGVLLSLGPVVASAVGWLLLDQPVSGIRGVAVVLVVIASIGSTLSAPRPALLNDPSVKLTP